MPMVPDILTVGDIPQFAGLIAPRRLLLCQPLWASGDAMSSEEAQENFAWTQSIFSLVGATSNLTVITQTSDESILQWLRD